MNDEATNQDSASEGQYPLTEADFRGLAELSETSEWFGRKYGHFPTGAKTVIARIRRGRWVKIPEAWRGQTTHAQTIRKRPSKSPRKARRGQKYGWIQKPADRVPTSERRQPGVKEELTDLLQFRG